MKSVKVFFGLLTGFATGALTGILLAPKKGSETRKELLKKKEDYTGVLKEKYDGLSKEITKQYEKAKGAVTNYAEKKKVKPGKAKKS